MKYFLLLVSIIIIIYSSYLAIKCIELFNSLTEYGKGYLAGSMILLAIGISALIYSLKKIKQTNKQNKITFNHHKTKTKYE